MLVHQLQSALHSPHRNLQFTLTQHLEAVGAATTAFGAHAVDLNQPLASTGHALVLEAARQAPHLPVEALETLLAAGGALGLDVNAVSPGGRSASYFATKAGCVDHVLCLLAARDGVAPPSAPHLADAAVAACRFLSPHDAARVLECVAGHDVVDLSTCCDVAGVTPLLAALELCDPDAPPVAAVVGGSRGGSSSRSVARASAEAAARRRAGVVQVLVDQCGVEFPYRRHTIGAKRGFHSQVGGWVGGVVGCVWGVWVSG